MNHHDVWALLDEFLDGSLAADARWAVAAHLEDCAVCRKHVATQARLRGIVRERLRAVEPPPGLSARISSALAAESVVPKAVTRQPWSPLPIRIAALLGPALAAIWLLASLATPAARPSADLRGELAATHALFAKDESLLDVMGDAATVTSWFRDEVGLQVSAPEFDTYTLVGGRLITLHGRAVAQLVYEDKPDEVYLSLLRFKHDGDDGTDLDRMTLRDGFAFGQQGTVSLVSWIAGEERVALVATLPARELRGLAEDLAMRSDDTMSPSP